MNVYWANIRNQSNQVIYIEVAEVGKNRWAVKFGDSEFKMRSKLTNPLELISQAVQERSAQDLPIE